MYQNTKCVFFLDAEMANVSNKYENKHCLVPRSATRLYLWETVPIVCVRSCTTLIGSTHYYSEIQIFRMWLECASRRIPDFTFTLILESTNVAGYFNILQLCQIVSITTLIQKYKQENSSELSRSYTYEKERSLLLLRTIVKHDDVLVCGILTFMKVHSFLTLPHLSWCQPHSTHMLI